MATRELLAELAVQYERDTTAAGRHRSRRWRRRCEAHFRGWEAMDVVVLASTAIDKLIAEGARAGWSCRPGCSLEWHRRA